MWAHLIIGILLFVGGLILIIWDDDSDLFTSLIMSMGIFFLMTALTIHVDKQSYKQGQIDALNNEYKYEKSIQYEYKDSNYTPVDTVYVKIE